MPGMTVRPPSSTTRSSGPVSTACAGADGGDAAVLDHHGGAGAGAVRVEDGGVAQDEPRHGQWRSRGSGLGSGTVLGHGGNDSDQKPTSAVGRPWPGRPSRSGGPMTLGAGDTVLCSGTLRAGISFRERLAAAQRRRLLRHFALGPRLPGGPRRRAARRGHPPAAGRPRLVGGRARSRLVVAPGRLRRSTFRPSTTRSRSSASASASCSPSPTRSGHARSTRSTSSAARGRSTRRQRPSPGCATGRPSTACSSTWSSCPGHGSPTWRRPGRSSVRPTGPTAASCSTPGTTSAAAPTARCSAPSRARRSSGVQLCDAPATPEADPLHATLHERLLPGDGELALPTLLADLRATGTAAPLGVEVFSDVAPCADPEEVGPVGRRRRCAPLLGAARRHLVPQARAT